MQEVFIFTKRRPKTSVFVVFLLISTIWMTFAGTLSYPYIMLDRQVQMIKFCNNGTTVFGATEFGIELSIPEGNCFLPNRIFPSDTGIQVLPKGFYFVLNEYIKGSVVENSKSTITFEPVTGERSSEMVMDNLKRGGFLSDAKVEKYKNKNGLDVILARNVSGLDAGTHYDWAFVVKPGGKYFFSVMLDKTDQREVFDYLVENAKAI